MSYVHVYPVCCAYDTLLTILLISGIVRGVFASDDQKFMLYSRFVFVKAV